jgi:hypothetical protein
MRPLQWQLYSYELQCAILVEFCERNAVQLHFGAKLVEAKPIGGQAARRVALALQPRQELVHLVLEHSGDDGQ